MSYNELLIKEVRKYKCLYDVSLKDYRNVMKKNMIWERVAKTLNSSSESCKRRWKTLRDMYKKLKRANKLASGSRSSPPKKKWKFQEALSFLDNVKDTRPTFGNVDIIKKDSTNFTECEELVSVNSTMKDFKTSCSEWMPNTVAASDLDPQSSSSASMPTPSSEKPIKKRAHNEINETFTEAMHKFLSSINEHSKVRKRSSTFLLFESLAAKITEANLSKADVNEIEVKVFSLIYEELSKYTENKF